MCHLIEQLRRFGDGILREQHPVDDVIRHALAQRFEVDAAIERDEAANAIQREPETQLDRRWEADAHDQHERERVGRENDDRKDPDLENLQLDDAAELDALEFGTIRLQILALDALNESTTGDWPGLDAQTNLVGPPRRHRQVEHLMVVVHAADVDDEAGADDLHADGVAHLGGDRGRDLEALGLALGVAEDAECELA